MYGCNPQEKCTLVAFEIKMLRSMCKMTKVSKLGSVKNYILHTEDAIHADFLYGNLH
jgi:hypothetical protein